MGFTIEGGITIEGGVTILVDGATPSTGNKITTEANDPLLTENSEYLITET